MTTTGSEERRSTLTEQGLVLQWWAEQRPHDLAIISPDGRRTFAELEGRANQLVRALRGRGVRPGESVALVCTNRPEFAEVSAACARSGLRLTPINWHLTSAEARYIASDCEATVIIGEPAQAKEASLGAGTAPRVRERLAIGRLSETDVAAGFESFEVALATRSSEPIEDPEPGTTMLYTSGTTGRPKGVLRRPGAALALMRSNIYGYREWGDVHLCTGPLYHAAPLAFSLSAPLTFGCAVVLMGRWDPEEALSLIDSHQVTHTHMVPTMFHQLLSLPEATKTSHELSSLRYVLHGAAPCPVSVKRRLIDWLGPIVFEYYAATEAVGSFVDSPTWLERPGTVGRPAHGQVKIGDEAGRELRSGETGLVWIRAADQARFAYFKDEAKTARAYRGDYVCLGDMGHLDPEGYLYLTDRTADVIICGGVNVYPAEVDAVILEHPAVADVATVGVPDPEWGEEVRAVVQLHEMFEPSGELAEELLAFTRSRLAHYKCPRSIEFTDRLPRQDTGKLIRRLVRDRFR